jgi:hypothetical protein
MTRSSSFLFLIFCTFYTFCVAQETQQSPPLQVSTKMLEELCQELEEEFQVLVSYEICPATFSEVRCRVAEKSEFPDLYRYLLLFRKEFQKYPRSFLEKTKLKYVAIIASLHYEEQARSALPDYYREILILDFLYGKKNPRYQQHVIHHEFYHLIEQELNGDVYWKDPKWASFNTPETEYGKGGKTMQDRKDAYPLSHPQTGFINWYSLSGLEEDKAEIFAILFVPEEYLIVEEWLAKDTVLQKKVKYMKQFLASQEPTFDPDYWTALHHPEEREEGATGTGATTKPPKKPKKEK